MSETRTLRVVIVGNSRGAQSALRTLNGTMDNTGRRAGMFSSTMSSALVRIGNKAKFAFGLAAVAAARFTYKAGAEYEQTLNQIAGLTDAQPPKIKKVAEAIEASSGQYAKYGLAAGDAAEGVVELVKAGQSLGSAMQSVNATMVLARAGNIEVANSAALVSNTLNVFKLKASQAAEVADALAQGANLSSADIDDLRLALSQSGNVAASTGLSLQETVTALAMLSNAGLKGSDAGTSLKTMLLRLAAPSKMATGMLDDLGVSIYDGTGKIKPFQEIIASLTPALSGLNDEARNNAIKKIFGDDAFRSAKVILGNGPKAFKDLRVQIAKTGEAQKLAEARSKGFSGAMQRLGAEIKTTAQVFFRQASPALGEFGNKVADSFTKNVPNIKATILELYHVGQTVADIVLPPLKVLGGILADLARFWASLPGPVKSFAIQAGLLLLVLPRVSAGVTSVTTAVGFNIARLQQLRAELSYTATRGQAMSAIMQRVGAATKAAAGVGGMLAMQYGAQHANTALGTLASVGGAAMLGFAVAGPWGAAIGAGAVGLTKLWKAGDHANNTFTVSKPSVDAFAGSLDKVSGAAGDATKDLIALELQKSGAINSANALGISSEDLTKAILGNAGAAKRVAAAMADANTALATGADGTDQLGGVMYGTGRSASDLKEDMAAVTSALGGTIKNAQQLSITSGRLSKALKGVKDRGKIVAQIETNGSFPKTAADVANLTRKFKLVPKDIKAVIKATGAQTTVTEVQKVIDKLNSAKKTKGDLPNFKPGVDRSLKGASTSAQTFASGMNKILKETTSKAKPNFNPFVNGVKNQLGPIPDSAGAQGNLIGNALKLGIFAGFDGTEAELARRAAAAVHAAVAAGMKAGDIHSPSRKMAVIGRALAQGLSVGWDSAVDIAEKAHKSITGAILNGRTTATGSDSDKPKETDAQKKAKAAAEARRKAAERFRIANKKVLRDLKQDLRDGLSDALGEDTLGAATKKIFDLGQKIRDAFNDKKLKKGQKDSLLDYLSGQNAKITALVAERERLVAGLAVATTGLEAAQAKLQSLMDAKQTLVDSTAGTAAGSATLRSAVDDEDPAAYNPAAILRRFAARLDAIKNFRANINKLISQGFSANLIQQIVAEGPDAGGQIASVLAMQSGSTLSQFNDLQSQIEEQSAGLGSEVGAYTYDGQIAGAQNDVGAAQVTIDQINVTIATNATDAAGIAAAIAGSVRNEIERVDKRNGNRNRPPRLRHN